MAAELGMGQTLTEPEVARRVRRIRVRAAVVFLLMVVAIELASNFAWSRYQGPPVWSRSGTPVTAANR